MFNDYRNQQYESRVINIMNDYTTKYSGDLADYKNSSLDFVATLQLKETLSVTKILQVINFLIIESDIVSKFEKLLSSKIESLDFLSSNLDSL